MVERFFAEITEKQIRRGVHRSTEELKAPISAYIDSANARPFIWMKAADDILAAIKQLCLHTLEVASNQDKLLRNSQSGHEFQRSR